MCTAYWDSLERLRCPDLEAEDYLDLSGYLKEKQEVDEKDVCALYNAFHSHLCFKHQFNIVSY